MKKELRTIENVRDSLQRLKGEKVKMSVNRGRRKIVKFEAVLTNTYPSVFTVQIAEDETSQSYSYTEVLCGNVKVAPKTVQI
jgi:uncharacterized protein Veg